MTVDVYLWEPCLSPHKSALCRELARLAAPARVFFVAAGDLPDDRRRMGWTADTATLEVIRPTTDSEVAEIVRASLPDAVHIFSGIRHVDVLRWGLKAVQREGRRFGLMHEPRVLDDGLGGARLLQSWLTEAGIRRRAGFVLAQGAHGPAWFRLAGYRETSIFPFAYFLDAPVSPPETLRAEGSLRLGYLGRLERVKGFDLVLKAVEGLPWCSLTVAGRGALEPALRDASDRHPGRVRGLGVIPMDQVPGFLGTVDLLVVPSRTTSDGWGAVVSEALMCGLPVVTTAKVGASIIVKRQSRFGEVIEKADAGSLSEALERARMGRLFKPGARQERAALSRAALEASAGAAYLMKVLRHLYNGEVRPTDYFEVIPLEAPSVDVSSAHRPVAAFVWDHFGPLHADRLLACKQLLKGHLETIGIQINGSSGTYSWCLDHMRGAPDLTLFPSDPLDRVHDLPLFMRLIGAALKKRASAVFLCHYDRPGVVAASMVLRALGKQVFLMGCPTFDDRPRLAWREFLKQALLLVYNGALVGGPATERYLAFLGFSRRPVWRGYNTVSTERLRASAAAVQEPNFSERDFIVVARLVKKKNLDGTLRAFAAYREICASDERRLHICGDGPEQAHLQALSAELGVAAYVTFHGFLQADAIAHVMRRGLLLILLSWEEQYGNVVPEAFSLGLPVLISETAGARFDLVVSGQNGFVIEPSNVLGAARAMALVSSDETVWRRLSAESSLAAARGDVAQFAVAVAKLMNFEAAA